MHGPRLVPARMLAGATAQMAQATETCSGVSRIIDHLADEFAGETLGVQPSDEKSDSHMESFVIK